ncbi:hypothetical protein ACS5PN_15645 [Roseateles sp. NT4]|uniref:hypothetical protein n=1 Tax=Roseateles sp. NT4 TaxID=3453715 RepID=UPI003EE98F9D
MRRRTALFALAMPVGPALAAGLGVNDYGFVDAVQVDAATGIATLALSIDRPLEDGVTKPKVRSKMLAYHQWVFVQRQLVERFPKARPELGVRLVLLHPPAKNALGTSVLEQLLGYARELRFEPVDKTVSP